MLSAFPPGRLEAVTSGDWPDARGLTGGNRGQGRWLEAGPQRGSCRAVIAAVVAGNLAAADDAWRGIDTAFAHQREDGGFEAEIRPNGKSARPFAAAVETSFFFLQELGRALLVIRQSPHASHFQERVRVLEPKLRRACAFMDSGYDTILPHHGHAVNRVLIAAKAFGTCGLVLNDPRLVEKSRRLVAFALTRRDDAGVFVEKGGRDSSYNAVSILFGQVLALHLPLPEFEAALPAAVDWQISRVRESGEVEVAGNTRTGVGLEPGYDGQPKRVNYNEVIQALTIYGIVRDDRRALEAADRVFAWSRRSPAAPARDASLVPVGATSVEKWGMYEIVLRGPSTGNPFLDVRWSARFEHGTNRIEVPGFYDGEGVYRARFMPGETGDWAYVTSGTVPELDGRRGGFTVTPPGPGNHGPVRVAHTFHFAYADGTPYRQIGTTCYAWTHQTEALQEQTLKTLANGPFDKIRFCVFPKRYSWNTNEPARY
ncbi:MAG: DUF5060 domain-containing protein, partial [Verrucomicrobiales bacterium]|nr:DUF5060 domain-containing protein [Verrucomicrobiales bacterium]